MRKILITLIFAFSLVVKVDGQSTDSTSSIDTSKSHLEKSADLKIASRITGVLSASMSYITYNSSESFQITGLVFTFVSGITSLICEIGSIVEFKKAGIAETHRSKKT